MAVLFRFALLLLLAPLGLLAQTPAHLPARPDPFTFVTDQAGVLDATEAKNLDRGLRQYADKAGTQVVVVTVKSLEGTDVGNYARALGSFWGVGQRGKDNGVIVLVAPAEHKVSIQPGPGVAAQLPPSLTARVISQQFGPSFKQGNYYAGLRAGLNVLLKAADPNPATAAAAPAVAAAPATAPAYAPAAAAGEVAAGYPDAPAADAPTPYSTDAPDSGGGGIGLGTIALVVLGIGAVWFLLKRRSAASAAARPNAPDFMGTGNPRNAGPGYNPGPGYGLAPGAAAGSSGPGWLGTAAAAAAGAAVGGLLANRAHGDSGTASSFGNPAANPGFGAPAPDPDLNPSAAHDYFAERDGGNETDYFANPGPDDSFSTDNSSYDDSSSGDMGGSFDSGSSDSGSSGDW